MIRTETLFDWARFDELIDFMDVFPGLVPDTVQRAFNVHIKTPLLTELRHIPGAVKYPIQWTSERQRKAFFASNGFGRGIPTKRTVKMAQAWKAGVIVGDNAVILYAENKVKHEQFVTGRYQQQFHNNTGWVKHEDTIDFWKSASREVIGEAVGQMIGRELK